MRYITYTLGSILISVIALISTIKDTSMCFGPPYNKSYEVRRAQCNASYGITHFHRRRGQRGGRIRHIKPIISESRKTKIAKGGVNHGNLIKITLQQASLQNANFGTINARSVRKNLNTLKTVVTHDSIDILSITETWLTDSDPYESRAICPEGYQFLRCDRKTGKGGGVGFLLRNSFNASVITTSSFSSFEHLAIEISTKTEVARILVIYRPPAKPLPKFIEEFTCLLEDLALGGSAIIISGDFNIHFDNPQDTYMKKFVELCEVFDLVQHVREPTHIKGHIVDFILNRSTDKLGIENVRICDLISDHFLVCSTSLYINRLPKQGH